MWDYQQANTNTSMRLAAVLGVVLGVMVALLFIITFTLVRRQILRRKSYNSDDLSTSRRIGSPEQLTPPRSPGSPALSTQPKSPGSSDLLTPPRSPGSPGINLPDIREQRRIARQRLVRGERNDVAAVRRLAFDDLEDINFPPAAPAAI